MRTQGKRLFSTLTVLLTACSTMFASSPHFECICPDGSRKPVCLSWLIGSSSCCGNSEQVELPAALPNPSNGECCRRKKPRVALQTQVPKPVSKNASGCASMSRQECQKTVVQSVAVETDECGPAIDHRSVSGFALFVLDQDSWLPFAAAFFLRDSTTANLPPPLDLAVFHQHLLI